MTSMPVTHTRPRGRPRQDATIIRRRRQSDAALDERTLVIEFTTQKGEKVAVDVPVHVTGESAPGTIHVVETQQISVEADATNLPEFIEVSVEGLVAGTQVTAG